MTTLLTMKGFNKTVTPITTAGIYHNPSLGLISLSSDGTNRITIADKNLGATQVYNDGDTLSEANCGKYYQRGNNYGFPFTGAVTTSSTQVNAQNYGPGNYYNNSTFICDTFIRNWSSVQNDNLWGAVTGTNEAMQGPCDNGYHVATQNELDSIVSALSTIGITTTANASKYLKVPIAGYRSNSSSDVSGQGTNVLYWTSTAATANSAYVWVLTYAGGETALAQALPIRPFKNTSVQPDDSWTVLYTTN